MKILIADDDADNRAIIELTLARAGHEVVIAVDGTQALTLAASEAPALIVLDMTMPGLDGWETARRLRANPELAGVPIIAFTAHAMAGEEQKALDAGCDGYLAKPCPPKKMVATINDWAEKIAASKGETK